MRTHRHSLIYLVDDLTIDLNRLQVFRKNKALKLADLSYRTLIVLLHNAPETVSLEELKKQVWQGEEVNPDTVTQRIALLRKSLHNPKNASKKYIASVRNQGYRLIPFVSNQQPTKINKITLFILVLAIVASMSVYWKLSTITTKTVPEIINVTTGSEDYSFKGWQYLKKMMQKTTV